MATYDFSNRTLVLTGANGGIGRAVAEVFYENGANLFLIDLDQKALDEFTASFHGGKGRVRAMGMDVCKPEHATQAAALVKETFAGLDFLVPSAGIYRAEPFAQMTDEQWRTTLSINLDGVFYLTRRLVPLLKENSAIVNLTSMAAHRGAFYNAHYSASKGALISFTKSIARELGPKTRVNAVSPGIIETPMTSDLVQKRGPETKEQTILKRFGAPREIATAIAFLCSEDASFITAEVMQVNGGLYVSG